MNFARERRGKTHLSFSTHPVTRLNQKTKILLWSSSSSSHLPLFPWSSQSYQILSQYISCPFNPDFEHAFPASSPSHHFNVSNSHLYSCTCLIHTSPHSFILKQVMPAVQSRTCVLRIRDCCISVVPSWFVSWSGEKGFMNQGEAFIREV